MPKYNNRFLHSSSSGTLSPPVELHSRTDKLVHTRYSSVNVEHVPECLEHLLRLTPSPVLLHSYRCLSNKEYFSYQIHQTFSCLTAPHSESIESALLHSLHHSAPRLSLADNQQSSASTQVLSLDKHCYSGTFLVRVRLTCRNPEGSASEHLTARVLEYCLLKQSNPLIPHLY